MKENLRGIKFALAYTSGNLSSIEKLAIDYSFMINQLGTIATRHSLALKNIRLEISEILSDNMTKDQIDSALENLITSIPKNHDRPLVDSQLKLIHRHLNKN